MNAITLSAICLSIIFLSTTLGGALVYFFRKNFSKKTGAIPSLELVAHLFY